MIPYSSNNILKFSFIYFLFIITKNISNGTLYGTIVVVHECQEAFLHKIIYSGNNARENLLTAFFFKVVSKGRFVHM